MGREEDIEEAGTGNLRLFKIAAVKVKVSSDCFGNLSRSFSESPCGDHRHVGREVSVLGVRRDFDDEFRNFPLRKFPGKNGGFDRLFNKLSVLRFSFGN